MSDKHSFSVLVTFIPPINEPLFIYSWVQCKYYSVIIECCLILLCRMEMIFLEGEWNNFRLEFWIGILTAFTKLLEEFALLFTYFYPWIPSWAIAVALYISRTFSKFLFRYLHWSVFLLLWCGSRWQHKRSSIY